jgi:hypothetical protein
MVEDRAKALHKGEHVRGGEEDGFQGLLPGT